MKRPSRIPKKIPAWAWKWLKWRTHKGPKPAPKPPAPTPVPTPPKPPKPPVPPKPKPKPFTPLEGVDGVSVPSGAQLKSLGKHFVGRYLSTPGNPKNLTKAEAADFHAHGIGIVLFFETTGTTFIGGLSAGRKDGLLAAEQLKALGVPAQNKDGSPIAVYFTIDADPHGRESQIVEYIHGAASVLTPARTGVYGGMNAVKACYDSRVCRYLCQAYAWSGGLWHPARHLEQYANGHSLDGHSVDLERQRQPKAGLWLP